MAAVESYKSKSEHLPRIVPGVTPVLWFATLAADAADSGDTIDCFDLPAGARILDCALSVGATLGASCTATLMLGETALTGATSAGGAHVERMTAFPPPRGDDPQTVRIAIGGADIAASAAVEVMVTYCMP